MSEFYKGANDILQIKVNNDWYPIACTISNSFSEVTEMIQTTTRDNNGFNTSLPTNQGFTVDFEGIETLAISVAGKVTYNNLQAFKRNRTKLEFKIGTVKVLKGFGHITSLSKTSPTTELVSFSGTLEGFGEYKIFDTSKNNVFNYTLDFELT